MEKTHGFIHKLNICSTGTFTVRLNIALFVIVSSGECNGGDFSGNTGVTNSPNYPGNYGNNIDCSYYFEVSTHLYAVLIFTQFNTESCCDYVRVSLQ